MLLAPLPVRSEHRSLSIPGVKVGLSKLVSSRCCTRRCVPPPTGEEVDDTRVHCSAEKSGHDSLGVGEKLFMSSLTSPTIAAIINKKYPRRFIRSLKLGYDGADAAWERRVYLRVHNTWPLHCFDHRRGTDTVHMEWLTRHNQRLFYRPVLFIAPR